MLLLFRSLRRLLRLLLQRETPSTKINASLGKIRRELEQPGHLLLLLSAADGETLLPLLSSSLLLVGLLLRLLLLLLLEKHLTGKD